MKLVLSLLVLAIAGGVVPSAVAGRNTIHDPAAYSMDVPAVPAQETPIVLAQAATPGIGSGRQQPDYLLKECAEIPTMAEPTSAERGIDPAGMVAVEIGRPSKRYILGDEAAMSTFKITLLQGPTHGKLVANTSGSGRVYYMYFINEAESGYAGKDKAVFMAEFEGKTYKVVVNMIVGPAIAGPGNTSTCPDPTLIKVNSKPVSGSTSYDSSYSLGSLSVTFADLTGAAVGQPSRVGTECPRGGFGSSLSSPCAPPISAGWSGVVGEDCLSA